MKINSFNGSGEHARNIYTRRTRNIYARLARRGIVCAVCVLCAAMAVCAASPLVSAQTSEPVVLFNGETQEFTFENVASTVDDAGQTVPDLFPSLKSIVPGDSITQTITLSVSDVPSDQQITIYLQAELENDDYTTLLQSASIEVVHEGEEITQSLAQAVVLGVFDSDKTQETTVTLTVPTSVGNEISGLSATIDWVFSAVYTSTTTGTTSVTTSTSISSPQTGDTGLLWLWVVLGVLSVCGMGLALYGIATASKK